MAHKHVVGWDGIGRDWPCDDEEKAQRAKDDAEHDQRVKEEAVKAKDKLHQLKTFLASHGVTLDDLKAALKE